MKNWIFLLILTWAASACSQKSANLTPSNPVANPNFTYLALGDSYTIGESVAVSDRYPVQLVDSLARLGVKIGNLRIVARTGWTTDELNTAIDASSVKDSVYDMVSLLIGVNNQYRGRSAAAYAPEFQALLNRAIGFAGGKRDRVFVVSIPDWGQTPFGSGRNPSKVALEIDQFNAVNDSIARAYGIRYFNITPISREWSKDAALVANDGLHPSGKQYGRWVNLMLPTVAKMLKP